MHRPIRTFRLQAAAATFALALSGVAFADEAVIRKTLQERLPDLPAIDEVTPTPVPGLFEVRLGTHIIYSDAKGEYVFEGGAFVDTKTRVNLTEARINKLTAIDFAKLPLGDAILWKNGNGARKLVVFADPNCTYCKQFERDLQRLKNVTVYTFLYPILGEDSVVKSRNIWCSKDRSQAWLGWMLDGKTPARTMGECSTPLERNVALGQKHRITGTPGLVFVDGTRVPGVMPLEKIEEQLLASAKAVREGSKK